MFVSVCLLPKCVTMQTALSLKRKMGSRLKVLPSSSPSRLVVSRLVT